MGGTRRQAGRQAELLACLLTAHSARRRPLASGGAVAAAVEEGNGASFASSSAMPCPLPPCLLVCG